MSRFGARWPHRLVQKVMASIRYRGGLVAAAVLPELVLSAAIVMQRHRVNIGVFPNILGRRRTMKRCFTACCSPLDCK